MVLYIDRPPAYAMRAVRYVGFLGNAVLCRFTQLTLATRNLANLQVETIVELQTFHRELVVYIHDPLKQTRE